MDHKLSSFRIIPNRVIDNVVFKEMAKELHNYMPLYRRCKVNKEGVTYNSNYMCWEIKITKDNIFFFFHTTNREDINVVKKNLNKCTILESKNNLNLFQNHIMVKELELKYHYFMSLDTDARKNEPIGSIIEIQKLLKDDDFALVQYILKPESLDWHYGCTEAFNKFKNGSMPKPIRFDKVDIVKKGAKLCAQMGLGAVEIMQELILDDESKIHRHKLEEEDVANILREKPLSNATLNKGKFNAYITNIRVIANSKDINRREQILRGMDVSFNVLQDDNYLISKNRSVNKSMLEKIENRKFSFNLVENILSTEEVAKLMFLPTGGTQDEYKIESIEMREVNVPTVLKDGKIPLGMAVKNGIETTCYWENKYNIITLPKVVVGPMGAGKTEITANFVVGVEKERHGAIVLDFIKGCELSKTIEKYIPKSKLVILDMSDTKNLFSLAFTEVKITDEMTRWDRLRAAGDLAEHTSYLINALNDNNSLQPLTPKMERVLNSACMVTYAVGYTKVYDVLNALQNWKFRHRVINLAIEKGIYTEDDMKITDLYSLDEIDVRGKIVGTKEVKIEGIMDRINTLLRNPYLELMLMAEPNYDIDFVRYMDEGKIILIRIPETTFKKKWVKDVLVTYFLSRIWMSTIIRGKQIKPKVCHIITDEIHQVQTAANLVAETITEGRKYGVGYYFTCQFLKQFRSLFDGVKSAGVSYMLLSGTEKENFKMLEEELGDFTVEELLNMKRFYSFNMIRTSEGVKKFISKLPDPL